MALRLVFLMQPTNQTGTCLQHTDIMAVVLLLCQPTRGLLSLRTGMSFLFTRSQQWWCKRDEEFLQMQAAQHTTRNAGFPDLQSGTAAHHHQVAQTLDNVEPGAGAN